MRGQAPGRMSKAATNEHPDRQILEGIGSKLIDKFALKSQITEGIG